MLSKFTNPYTGSVLLIQRPAEAAAFVARQPLALPVAPPPAPTPSLAYRLAIGGLRVVAVLLLVLLLALWFFLFGEERSERVRPDLTPAQRTAAFRIPKP
jgi:hypothetical protein